MVSGMIQSTGHPHRIMKLWEEEQIILITSPEIIEEVKRVLSYPRIKKRYSLSPETIDRCIMNLYRYSLFLQDVPALHGVSRDPDDDKFLAVAVAGRADHLISGDAHLLELHAYKGIEIITPKQFQHIR